MKYENQKPHDDYGHFEEINLTDFVFTYTDKYGISMKVHHDETDGDTITLPSGRVIDDPDEIDTFLDGRFDHYWDAAEAEQMRLSRLRDEMEQAAVSEGRTEYAEMESDYRRAVCG